MCKKRQRSPVLPVVILLLLHLAGCAALFQRIETPKLNIVNLKLQEATVFEQSYLITLRFQNPNNFDIPVDGLRYDIELNGQHFAGGVSNHSIILPALDSAVIQVKAISTLMSFFRQFSNLQQGRLETISYRLNGKIHLSGFQNLYFDYKGKTTISKILPSVE